MVSVNFKLAILTVLAKWPERRATVDEVRREVGIIIANEDQAEQLRRLSALGDIDIFQTGLVSRNEEGFQITDAGLSLLQSLESSSGPSPEVSTAPASQPFRLIDDLIGTEERLKIFDLELRRLENIAFDGSENNSHQPFQDQGNRAAVIEVSGSASPIAVDDEPESVESEASDAGEGDHDDHPVQGEENQPVLLDAPYGASADALPFLRRSFGSKGQDSGRKSLQLASLVAFIAAKQQSILALGRRYFAQETSRAPSGGNEGLVRSVGGAAFALLSLILVIACVVAAIAFGQIQSLKTDVAALRRELLPLRERVAKLEQIEKENRDLDQQQEAQSKSETEKNQPGGEIRPDQTALNLSREEIQLIREYIKPAPSADTTAPAINVGDPVSGVMIPLPSQLTEKVPKLLGGKFTTRNGAIIIVKRASRQADAVLVPN